MQHSGTWFVTKCVEPRRPAITPEVARLILDALRFYVEQDHLMLAAFCAMPDHWHFLGSPVKPRFLPSFMAKLDRWLSGQTAAALARRDCAWQDGYHDTRIRSGKQFRYVAGYIDRNPVEQGLVSEATDWPWSSAAVGCNIPLTRPWPWTFEDDRL